jgi:hypothetical protein
MKLARPHVSCLLLATLVGCGGKAPPPAAETATGPVAEAPAAPAAAQLTDADLGAAIRAAVAMDVGDARYFDSTVDLNGDGVAEVVVYLAGPMVCGTGGCPMFVFTPGPDGYRLVSQFSVVRPPVRISPRSSQGWRNLVVGVGGGGLAAGSAELKHDGTGYPSNPTVAPAEPLADLEGTGILIPEFGSYTEGKAIALPGGASAGDYGDPQTPVAGRVYGTAIHTQDAEELRYVVLKALTDTYGESKGITVTQAEKAEYVADVREVLSRDPAMAATLREESAEDQAVREEIADAFIRQWKINAALHEQYGGRIIFQQGGPEPLDAYRRFLEERQAAGDFEIVSEPLAAEFWKYYRDDSIHSFFEPGSEEEAQVFATPPWSSK